MEAMFWFEKKQLVECGGYFLIVIISRKVFGS
jgi:hypothetical protein